LCGDHDHRHSGPAAPGGEGRDQADAEREPAAPGVPPHEDGEQQGHEHEQRRVAEGEHDRERRQQREPVRVADGLGLAGDEVPGRDRARREDDARAEAARPPQQQEGGEREHVEERPLDLEGGEGHALRPERRQERPPCEGGEQCQDGELGAAELDALAEQERRRAGPGQSERGPAPGVREEAAVRRREPADGERGNRGYSRVTS
jgi:hypothetical protein